MYMYTDALAMFCEDLSGTELEIAPKHDILSLGYILLQLVYFEKNGNLPADSHDVSWPKTFRYCH